MENKKILVYISHPSGGKVENTLETEEFIKLLYQDSEIFDKFCFVSPIHCYGFMYDDVEYYKGLSFCTDLLKHCDMMLLLGKWEESTGCTKEKEMCDKLNIPYIEIKTVQQLKGYIKQDLCKDMLKICNK